MEKMFLDCKSLISVDLQGFNTKNVINMEYMFGRNYFLDTINIDSFDLTNTKKAASMFFLCQSLKKVALKNENINGKSSSIDMSGMFEKCYSLTDIDLTNFERKKIEKIQFMFFNCSNLTSIDTTKFDTSESTNFYSIFHGCTSLTSLNLTQMSTDNVTTMNSAFNDCISLESLDLSNWITSNVTSMTSMFYNCNSLKWVKLDQFDTSRVNSMQFMFEKCYALESIDLSMFDIRNALDFRRFFKDCKSLINIDLSNFNGSRISSSMRCEDMFDTNGPKATIKYNSNIFGKYLENEIPDTWDKIDISENDTI
jgi:surface protein